ncbi:MAG: DUF1343 domain-containing protein [Bacteroidota bacterium]|nr:DUF1343 domain-containing protein [Bacteroidota bacterium]
MRRYQIVLIFFVSFLLNTNALFSQHHYSKDIIPGADRTWIYLPFIGDKPFAVVSNHASLVKGTPLVDTLLSLKCNLKKIFCPEHGFRGKAEAGAYIYNSTDSVTGLPVISLYGNHKKPLPQELDDVDIILFDLQDVGTRFYTYISTLTYVMEACAENNKTLIILDRPNPNGFYVDGPVLEKGFESFVGMHRVPVVHGMTIAEYAKMVNEEGWINSKVDMLYVKCLNYDHNDFYKVPVKPSPNLPNMSSIYLYPSLCFFEGTVVSVGRGTDNQFQIFGHPKMENFNFSFTPQPNYGSSHPKQQGKLCYGKNVESFGEQFQPLYRQINLDWLVESYQNIGDKTDFFNKYFDKLAGTDKLRKKIISGWDAKRIRESWQEDLVKYKVLRKRYLLYKDFE